MPFPDQFREFPKQNLRPKVMYLDQEVSGVQEDLDIKVVEGPMRIIKKPVSGTSGNISENFYAMLSVMT